MSKSQFQKEYEEYQKYKEWQEVLCCKNAQEVIDFVMSNYLTEDEKCKTIAEQSQRISELEEQLANNIRPKFKMGDYVYSVRKFGKQILLAEGNITSITKLDDGSIHYHLVAEPHNFGVSEDTCYKTMEEAHDATQKLLEEINNE